MMDLKKVSNDYDVSRIQSRLVILGIRGVPAEHGGFETFAEHLSHYLVGRGWDVTVYCQRDGSGNLHHDEWCGIKRVNIPVRREGALGTIEFDWKSIKHLIKQSDPGVVLTLGYNTAFFCTRLRLHNIRNLINMDGIEWRRDKWKWYERAWLWLNERVGCLVGNHLIADHPAIADHLATRVNRRKITMIPYGANEIVSADAVHLVPLGLEPGRFITVIARPEPENSILDIVHAFSHKRRDFKLVLLGKYQPDSNLFHKEVMAAASDEVLFLGAIYDKTIVEALRFHGRLYIHGHRVGGTNPSLVEALGAGSAVLAHDNRFNRWVAGAGARYFSSTSSCSEALDNLLTDDAEIERMKIASRMRYEDVFTWETILNQYEQLLCAWLPQNLECLQERAGS